MWLISEVEIVESALKSQVFAQKSTVVKWNFSILWIDIVWGLQKLGLILESKVVQKLSLEKKCF